MKNKRHEKILEIISQSDTVTQSDITNKLIDCGFNVTQATVSRDIKQMGLVKVSTGSGGGYKYTLPNSIVGSNARHRSVFEQSVISIEAAMHTIVIKTLTGMAQAACVAIDSCIGDKIVGSIAGDDTILIIKKDVEKAKEAEKALNDMLKKPA